MKINIDIEKSAEYHRVELEVRNGKCRFDGFILLKLDELENLELELTNLVQKLYDYRQKQEAKE